MCAPLIPGDIALNRRHASFNIAFLLPTLSMRALSGAVSMSILVTIFVSWSLIGGMET